MALLKFCMVMGVIHFSQVLSAQQNDKISPYLMDTFVDGALYYHATPPRKAKFNYHLVGQEIVMDFNDSKVTVNNFPNLDSVLIGAHSFILVEGKSYEVLIGEPIKLLVDYRFTSQIEPNEGAYGTKSQTTGVIVANQRFKVNDFYALHWNDEYELVNRTEFWIVQDGKWSKFNNANQLIQIFKERKKEIKDFTSDNKIDFHNTDHVRKLVMFVLGG